MKATLATPATNTIDKLGQSIIIDKTSKSDKTKTPLDFLFDGIKNTDIIILKALTGSGKSTSMPVYMLRKFPNKKIAMTQPRIVNVESIRDRIRDLTGTPELVGSITGDSRNLSGKGTERLILYTEGAYNTDSNDDWIIIDEAHERKADVDFLLWGLLDKIGQGGKTSPKIIITSATIDPNEIIKYIREVNPKLKIRVAEIEGVPAYYTTHFLKENVDNYVEKAVDIINNTINVENRTEKRNILVFLPSVAIIKSMSGILNRNKDNSNIIEFYKGEIDFKSKMIGGIVNIILATNVAETGISIPNLKYVIDSGWTNNNYYNPESNVDMLLKEKITDNMAIQRWGRSGRNPDIKGCVYCLYTEDFYNAEIKNQNGLPSIITDRNDQILLKTLSINNIKLMDDIPPQIRERGIETLYLIWAIDEERKITDIGRKILDLRIEPRWGKMILAGIANDCVYPVVASISFIMTGTNTIGMPKMYNYYFSDHWEYWLLFTKYWNSPALIGVKNKFIQLNNILEKLNLRLDIKVEDSNDLWNRFKQCIYSGIYQNLACQSSDDPSVYISNMNPEVIGKVSGSSVFQKDFKSVFPKKIVYDSASLIYNAFGQAEYKFKNVSRAD